MGVTLSYHGPYGYISGGKAALNCWKRAVHSAQDYLFSMGDSSHLVMIISIDMSLSRIRLALYM